MRYTVLLLSLCLLTTGALVGCTQESKPAGPTFTGRLFFLTGDKTKGADLAELTAGPTNAAHNYQVVTSGLLEAVASPDQTKLLYTTKDGVMLRDFGSGAVKSLIKGDSFCLAWATDGNHFSYKQKSGETTKLYAADLEGKTKLILDYPNDSEDCAQWISAERLVFDRFVGAAQKKANEQLKPNTTTVATIGDAVKTKDSPRKWTVESVCAKNDNAFLRSADQGKLLVGNRIDHFESLDPSPASCSECRFVGYAAQSCVPFFTEQASSTSTEVFYLNPTNWQKQKPATINRTFSPSAKAVIKSSAKLMVIGDAGNLFLVDTESGAIVALLDNPIDSSSAATAPAPIVWIER